MIDITGHLAVSLYSYDEVFFILVFFFFSCFFF